MIDRHAQRRERLRERLHKAGLPALLVSSPANRFYLSGFELHDPQCNESAGLLVVDAAGKDWLLTDPRYEIAAAKVWPKEQLFIYTSPKVQQIRDFLAGLNYSALGFESRAMSYDFHVELKDHIALTPTQNNVEILRRIKDEYEIALMEASCKLNHEIFAMVPDLLQPGRTEREIAWEMEKLFREHGAQELAFPTIIGVNANAAQPHAVPDDTPVREECLVLVDAGARLSAYCSDQTRTFWVGAAPPPDGFKRTMDLVRKAQDAAIEAIRPGKPVAEAYHLVKAFFRDHLVDERFNHGLGHGIGLETHEAPSLGPHDKTTLAPGMIVTVEPGLYYPEWGGIRWEYMILVTEDGCRIL